MPEHRITGGAVAYTDAEGAARIGWQGQTIDFTDAEAERLMAIGMLYDEEAERAAAEAEEARLQEAREQEDQRRADEAERLEGERAAAAALGTDEPPEGLSAADIRTALGDAGVDPGSARSRKELWALLPTDARAPLV